MRKLLLFVVVSPFVLLFAQEEGKTDREGLKRLIDSVVKAKEKVRKAVVGEEGVFEFLLEAVGDDDSLRRFLLYEKSRWGALSLRLVLENPELPSLVGSEDRRERLKALEWLAGRNDADSHQLLIGALNDKDAKVRLYAIKALGDTGDKKVTEPLLNLLGRAEDETAYVALLEALGDLKDERAVGALLRLLEHRNALVASKAAESIGKIGNRGVVPVLVKVARKSTMTSVRYSAVFALGELGDSEPVDMLLGFLKSEDASLRYAAAHSLAMIADEKALDALLEVLCSDTSWGVRWAAAKGVGRICKGKPNTKAVGCLIDALLDENETVRKEALSSLRAVTGEDFGDDYEKWVEWFKKEK